MSTVQPLAILAAEIAKHRQPGRPLRVAIDGRCASGKTVLANQLATELGGPVIRASVDSFHHPVERRYRQGEFSARGYYEDAFDYEAVLDYVGGVAPGTVLLFDGVFLFRQELNAHWEFRILLDADAATSVARALARDTGLIGTAEVVRRKYAERYEPAWQLYVAAEQPEAKADVIVDHRDFDRPRIVKHTML